MNGNDIKREFNRRLNEKFKEYERATNSKDKRRIQSEIKTMFAEREKISNERCKQQIEDLKSPPEKK